ncbi:MAG: Xylulose kinase [Tenericutes bacterium ADurb.Bin087]|nr:MAG: Xylulose kinase [Tenericutes bacterium ADurb.Bin087]
MSYIGLDIGTTMVKGQLLDDNGAILRTEKYESPTYSADGIFYLDATKLKQIIFEIIKNLVEKSNAPIKSICTSTLGEAFVLIDEAGTPLNDFILFTSNLGEKEKDELLTKIEPLDVADIAGLYPNKMFSFSKLMWLKKEKRKIYDKADKMLLVTGYIAFLLTGKKVSDYSTASRTMLLDIQNKCWSEYLIALCGLKYSLFPGLMNADEVVGKVKEDVAVELGLCKDCIVLAGGHDQYMAAIGSGLFAEGMANDGTGTAQCVAAVFSKITDKETFYKNNYCVVPYINEGTYITYAFLNTGGALLKWHRDYLSPLEFNSLKDQYYSYFSSQNVKIPTSLLVVPHFSGSGTPYLCGDDTGGILGLTTQTTKAQIYFALMEGATYEMKYNLEMLEKSGINVSEMSVTGGGSKNKSWLKIKANIYNKEVSTILTPEGGIYGCFIVMKHNETKAAYVSLFDKYVTKGRSYKPNEQLTRKYHELYQKYKRIYNLTKEIWR